MIESPTILVIEDDPAVRTGIVDTLEYGGYQTLQASDGHEGMKMALQSTYRLLLLDIVMPGPSGFEILAARGEHDDRLSGPGFF